MTFSGYSMSLFEINCHHVGKSAVQRCVTEIDCHERAASKVTQETCKLPNYLYHPILSSISANNTPS